MICKTLVITTIVKANTRHNTTRGTKGFGSVGVNTVGPLLIQTAPLIQTPLSSPNDGNPYVITYDIEDYYYTDPILHESQDKIMGIVRNIINTIELPFQISLGSNLFDDVLSFDILTRGHHPMLGLELYGNVEIGHRLYLLDCAKFAPAVRIPHGILTLRHLFHISIGDTKVTSIDDI